MVFAGERWYKLQRIIFTAIGLWPYQKPLIWQIQTIFFFSVYCCSIFFQLTAFLTTTCNVDCFLKRFSYICLASAYALCYYSFYFNSEVVKQILEHMQLDWKTFENSDVIKVFEEYLFGAYIFTLFVYLIIPTCLFIFMAIECKPIILDAVILMNVSRPRKIEVDYELFLDKQEYFFLYVIQEILGIAIGLYSLAGSGTVFIMLGRHCCASYKIASCLIQNTVKVHTLQIPDAQKIQFMHQSICLSVYIHRRTVQFVKDTVRSFDLWYFPLISMCILSLSCLMFRLYNAIIKANDWYDILVTCMILYIYFMYMVISNFLGQLYTEHSIEILKSSYDIVWYLAPLPIQKLLLIMQRSVQAHTLKIGGGLFTVSVEGFSTILTSAVSYFTVLHTIS